MLNKATVFRFTSPANSILDEARLAKALSGSPSRDCEPTQEITRGWTPIIPGTSRFVLRVGDALFFKMRICEKKIPAKAIKSELEKRVRKLEDASGNKVKRAEKQEIMDQIKLEFLPKTIQTESAVIGAVDLRESYLIVDENRKKAEDFCSFLRATLGSLPVVKLGAEQSTHVVFSQLIQETLEIANIMLGDAATLENLETKEKATLSNTDLHCDEVKAHVNSQMVPRKIRLHFGDSSSAVVTDDLDISGIKISEAVREQQGYDDIEDLESKVRADLFIWNAAVAQMIDFMNPGLSIAPARP